MVGGTVKRKHRAGPVSFGQANQFLQWADMLIVDAHLDLAYNALRGREMLRPAREQTADAEGIPSVGLPDLRAGGVGLICATIFCAPDSPKERGYRTPDEAHAMAMDQLRWYRQQADAGEMAFVIPRGQLVDVLPDCAGQTFCHRCGSRYRNGESLSLLIPADAESATGGAGFRLIGRWNQQRRGDPSSL